MNTGRCDWFLFWANSCRFYQLLFCSAGGSFASNALTCQRELERTAGTHKVHVTEARCVSYCRVSPSQKLPCGKQTHVAR